MESHDEIPKDLPQVSLRKLFVIGLVVVLLFAGAFVARLIPDIMHRRELAAKADQEENAAPVVDVTLPEPQPSEVDLSLPADVKAWAQTAIYARVDGYLKHWLFDINAHVQTGQLLAEIEAPDTDAQLNEAIASLQQAKASAISAESNDELAQATFERYHGLLSTGGVTQQDLDTRQSAAAQADASKAAADAAVKSAEATVERLQAQKGFERIIAPFSGTITVRNYDTGARISASSTNPGQEMFDIADTETLRVFVNVPQGYVNLVQIGQPVYLMVSNYPGRKFVGYVARSSGVIDPSSRTLYTELDFDNHNHELWAGMYGTVHIGVHNPNPTLTVPTTAMMFEADGTLLAVVDDDNKVHFQKVTVGQDFGTRLEILNGLSKNEKVVTNPGERIQDGSPVQITTSNQSEKPAVAEFTPGPATEPTTRVVANIEFDSNPASHGGGLK
jgi:membrane fusion protein, multidrug efflux system